MDLNLKERDDKKNKGYVRINQEKERKKNKGKGKEKKKSKLIIFFCLKEETYGVVLGEREKNEVSQSQPFFCLFATCQWMLER